ncbi:MAG: hypothetical protein RIR62_2879 [Pseudomonadota bacterium]
MTRQLLIYDRMVPVSFANHGGLCLQATGRFDFAARLNAIPLLAAEFAEAGLDHPVVFLRQSDGVFPVALTGLRPDRNEHVGHDGRWGQSYLPAFLRRYPFALARDGGRGADMLALCLDESYAGLNRDGRGERLFDSEGQQTAFLRRAIDMAADYHAQHHRTAEFCARIDALGLLDPAEAAFTYWSGRAGSLGGFSIISRTRLHQLPQDEVLSLFGSGGLERIHAHLASLSRIETLREAAGHEGGGALAGPRAAAGRQGTVPPAADDAGHALQRALDAVLKRPALVARSRKIAAGHPAADRRLFTFGRADLHDPDTPDALEPILGHPVPQVLRDLWTRARIVHLGLDSGDPQEGAVRKLYLEFPPDAAPEPGLVYLSAKTGRRSVIHRYERVTDAAALIGSLTSDPALRAAVQALAERSQMLLKVHEAGGKRLSLDINLADLSPEPALQNALDDLVARIDPDAPRAGHWPSHVAIGQDGAGKPFVTLYGWPDAPAP